MKKFFVSWLLISLPLFSQIKSKVRTIRNGFETIITVPSANYKDKKAGKYIVRDFYDFTDPSRAGCYKLPEYLCFFAIPQGSKPVIKVINKEVRIFHNVVPAVNPAANLLNDSTVIFTKTELKGKLRRQSLRPDVQVKRLFLYRDFYCAAIAIKAYRFLPAKVRLVQIKKLQIQFTFGNGAIIKSFSPIKIRSKFDIILESMFQNAQIAEQFRIVNNVACSADSVTRWIDFHARYLKIGIGEDGIFRIYPKQLEKAGVNPASVIPRTFEMFESGREIPIYVDGEEDGRFDDTDFIEFYGHRNYSKISDRKINRDNEDYNVFLNRYTDTTYYFLTWGVKQGLRVFRQESKINGKFELNYYTCFNHYEKNNWFQFNNNDETKNQLADWHKNKGWFWRWLGDWNSPVKFNFNVKDVAANKRVDVFLKLVSSGANFPLNAHRLALYLNGIKIDSANVNRFQQVLLKGSISSDKLKKNNTLKAFNYGNGVGQNFLAVDWYEVEYPRKLSLVNDSLIFKVPYDVKSKTANIKIKNSSGNNYIIYKIFPAIKRIENISASNGELTFTDSVNPGDEYCVFAERKIKTPENIKLRKIKNLIQNNFQSEYIAITHSEFSDAVDEYLTEIQKRFNVKPVKILVSDIYDEFGYGYPYPESIKLFLRAVLSHWKAPAPVYLELIGDATYDYKYYVYKTRGVRKSFNYVPSYGVPLGDNWYVIADDSVPLPQMEVGRLPVETSEELKRYLNKIILNSSSGINRESKNFLFFSGGYGNDPEELTRLRKTNQYVIDNYIKPRPVAGVAYHFYKTLNPFNNFAPYSAEEFEKAVSGGAVIISYLGHSGTATWDNGINSVSQLRNNANAFPLISDFGCSTNKFGEPDMISFGERFVLDENGQAIGYIGFSSLGFENLASVAPLLFYSSIFKDNLKEIGMAHLSAKIKLFQALGVNNLTRIFSLSNVLVGDPVVELKLPEKPELDISTKSLLSGAYLNESRDSKKIRIKITNLGLAPPDSFEVEFDETYKGHLVNKLVKRRLLPAFNDTLIYLMQTVNRPGKHKLRVTLDVKNEISEKDELNNAAEFSFDVFSLSLKDYNRYKYAGAVKDSLILLNPRNFTKRSFQIIFDISNLPNSKSFREIKVPSTPFFTVINLKNLLKGKRWWYRYKINSDDENYSQTKTFTCSGDFNFLLNDSISFSSQELKGLSYLNGLALSNDSVDISVFSAGKYSGATLVITRDGRNLLTSNFFTGMGLAAFNPVTLQKDTAFWKPFFHRIDNINEMAEFINNLPKGEIVAMGVSDDARNNITPNLINAIKTLGSAKIDSLSFQGSWALIGSEGAPYGAALEKLGGRYQPAVSVDSVFVIRNSFGYLKSEKIGPASAWNYVKTDFSGDSNNVLFEIFGLTNNGETDTLNKSNIKSFVSLKSIPAFKYPFLQLFVQMKKGVSKVTRINKIGVEYLPPPELGLNYQSVSLSRDTIVQKDSVIFYFTVYNASPAPADSVVILTDLILPDKSKKNLMIKRVNFPPYGKKKLSVAYVPDYHDGYGKMSFEAEVDPNSKIREYFKDNNYYKKDFFVKRDTSVVFNSAVLKVLFDGREIFNNDFVESHPEIIFKFHYTYGFNFKDSNRVKIFLDGNKISASSFNFVSVDSLNNKMILDWQPNFTTGRHLLEVRGKNIFNNSGRSNGYVKYFEVAENSRLSEVYNYPNPFAKDTYFLFKLSRLPDELQIKIFTIAGRLIKTFSFDGNNLNLNQNKIYWDGRDADGNTIANGLYIAEFLIKSNKQFRKSFYKIVKIQ